MLCFFPNYARFNALLAFTNERQFVRYQFGKSEQGIDLIILNFMLRVVNKLYSMVTFCHR